MIIKLIMLLSMLLGVSVHCAVVTAPTVQLKPQQIHYIPTIEEQQQQLVDNWPAQQSGEESVINPPAQEEILPIHQAGEEESQKGQKIDIKGLQNGYYFPHVEEQVTVYPQKDDEDVDNNNSKEIGGHLPPWIIHPPFYPSVIIPWHKPASRPTTTTTTTRRPTTTTRRPTTTTIRPITIKPTTTKRPKPTPPPARPTVATPKPAGDKVQVLENYQIISNNGIVEYKLRLSNGLIDHKKITKKRVGNQIIYVQSGYYSTPVDPKRNKIDLIYYIADERGFRITGVESCSSVHSCGLRSE